MSTAHRILDGDMYWDRTANNRRIKRWRLNDAREDILYKGPLISTIHQQYGFVNLHQIILRCTNFTWRHLQSLQIVMGKYMVQVNHQSH